MAVSFRQAGKLIDVELAAAVDYHGLVAIGDNAIGIARHSGVSGDVISCDAEGVFTFVKASGSALTQGTPVTVAADSSNDDAPTATATSAGAVSNGIVWKTAASADTTVEVKINVFIAVPAAAAQSNG